MNGDIVEYSIILCLKISHVSFLFKNCLYRASPFLLLQYSLGRILFSFCIFQHYWPNRPQISKKKKLLIPSSFPSNINMHFMEEIDLNVSAWKKTILETNVSAWKKMILGTTIERTSSCIRTPSLIMVKKKRHSF